MEKFFKAASQEAVCYIEKETKINLCQAHATVPKGFLIYLVYAKHTPRCQKVF